jgi:hypothetical protein
VLQRENHSKVNSSKRKPEPEPVKVQDSGLKKDVFGPSQFFTSEFEHVLKNMKKKKVSK